jgi:glutamate racemase
VTAPGDPDAPIGIFDSGVGGLTVARAVLDQMPHERLLYVGDTGRGPYGPQPLARVREMSLEIMDFLVASGVKMLVIACNSASAACLRDARERYDIPVVEVVHPAARRAAAATRNGKVGVIGTAATIASGAYEDAFAAVPSVELVTAACPELVELVEAGQTHGEHVQRVTSDYLAPVLAAGVDTLVLGCTHYPLLLGPLAYVAGDGVTLVSSAEETAKDVYRVLVRHGLARPDDAPAPRHVFLSTGDPERFRALGRRFLGPEVEQVAAAHLPAPTGSAPSR